MHPEHGPDPRATPLRQGRPPNLIKLAGDRPLAERIPRIAAYHAAAQSHAAQAIECALRCGLELLAASDQAAHGQWDQWVEANCPFAAPTAWRYMQAAERAAQRNPAALAALARAQDLLPAHPEGKPPARPSDALQGAFDAPTLRQLYLDLGVLTAAERHNPGGDHGGGKARAERLRNLNKADLELFQAAEQWQRIVGDLRDWVQRRRFLIVSQADVAAGVTAIREALRAISI